MYFDTGLEVILVHNLLHFEKNVAGKKMFLKLAVNELKRCGRMSDTV